MFLLTYFASSQQLDYFKFTTCIHWHNFLSLATLCCIFSCRLIKLLFIFYVTQIKHFSIVHDSVYFLCVTCYARTVEQSFVYLKTILSQFHLLRLHTRGIKYMKLMNACEVAHKRIQIQKQWHSFCHSVLRSNCWINIVARVSGNHRVLVPLSNDFLQIIETNQGHVRWNLINCLYYYLYVKILLNIVSRISCITAFEGN